MANLIKLLDQLEGAIPDIRDALGGGEPDGDEGGDEESLPPLPDDLGGEEDGSFPPMEDDGAEDPMAAPFPPKKKKNPFA